MIVMYYSIDSQFNHIYDMYCVNIKHVVFICYIGVFLYANSYVQINVFTHFIVLVKMHSNVVCWQDTHHKRVFLVRKYLLSILLLAIDIQHGLDAWVFEHSNDLRHNSGVKQMQNEASIYRDNHGHEQVDMMHIDLLFNRSLSHSSSQVSSRRNHISKQKGFHSYQAHYLQQSSQT